VYLIKEVIHEYLAILIIFISIIGFIEILISSKQHPPNRNSIITQMSDFFSFQIWSFGDKINSLRLC